MLTPSSRIRHILGRAALFTLYSALIIGSAELYLRSQGYSPQDSLASLRLLFPADSELGWSLFAAPRVFAQNNDELRDRAQVFAHIWPGGARASYPVLRSLRKYNVLVLGCSHTYGVGLSDQQTFVWKLNDRYRNATFHNYGTVGYGTYQCYLYEKRLFRAHPDIHFDLVIYAATEHHILRNVGNACLKSDNVSLTTPQNDRTDDAPKNGEPSDTLHNGEPSNTPRHSQQNDKVDILKCNSTKWCYPVAYLKSDHSLGERPALRRWPGDNYLALINVAKRLYLFYTDRYIVNQGITPEAREVFRLILEKMNECARQHGARFATICLEDEGETQLSQIHPTNIPYVFVTNGREGQPNGPQFHNGGFLGNHGTALVNTNWAKHISAWLDSYWPAIACRRYN